MAELTRAKGKINRTWISLLLSIINPTNNGSITPFLRRREIILNHISPTTNPRKPRRPPTTLARLK